MPDSLSANTPMLPASVRRGSAGPGSAQTWTPGRTRSARRSASPLGGEHVVLVGAGEARRGQRHPLTVRETAVPELLDTPGSQHLFQAVAACRKSAPGPRRAGVWESFDLQHREHASPVPRAGARRRFPGPGRASRAGYRVAPGLAGLGIARAVPGEERRGRQARWRCARAAGRAAAPRGRISRRTEEADHAPNSAHPGSSRSRSACSRATSGSSSSCRTSGGSCRAVKLARAAPRMHGRLEYDPVGHLQPCAWHRSRLRRGREPRVGRIARRLAT